MVAHTAWLAWNWLVTNNLLKDVVQLSVAAVFGYVLGRLPWKHLKKRQAHNQAEIMDKLDANTPGGLGDISTLLQLLPQAEVEATTKEEGENT
jgi:hypothetical protein